MIQLFPQKNKPSNGYVDGKIKKLLLLEGGDEKNTIAKNGHKKQASQYDIQLLGMTIVIIIKWMQNLIGKLQSIYLGIEDW